MGHHLPVLFILSFLLFTFSIHGATFNPHAGLATNNLLIANLSSSSVGTSIDLIRDGDPNTAWESGNACLPSDWVSRSSVNILKGLCLSSPSSCSPSSPSFTDGDSGTSSSVGSGIITLTLTTPAKLLRVGLKAVSSSSPISVQLISGSTTLTIGSYTSSNNWQHINFAVSSTLSINSIKLTSSASFTLIDVSAMKEECFEYVIADFGASKEIGQVFVKLASDTNSQFSILTSSSFPYSWTTRLGPLPTSPIGWQYVGYVLPTVNARYLMFKVSNPTDYRKLYIFELRVYNRYGVYGAPYSLTRQNSRNLSDIIGINGIWGWGNSGNGETPSSTTGPGLYSPIASHARNYHSLSWDLTKPSDVVYYNVTGTPGQWWLNWNDVYSGWKNAGFKFISASIQFVNDNTTTVTAFSQSKWANPFSEAYTYGRNFAANFGPSNRNLITTVEIGNEPWDYDADFYVKILEGMSQGLKAGDTKIQVMPGAFQADTPDFPPNGDNIFWNGKYAGFRISANSLPYLNILNSHAYSYAPINNVLRGVRPEHPASSFYAFRNMLRWRDANMPAKEVWLTEWGWDGSDSCVDSRCVSLSSQGVYAIRGALIGAREGLGRMTWFFYSDGSGTGNYDRSGVVFYSESSVKVKKPVYYGFQNLLSVLGGFNHLKAIREGSDAYIYVLAKSGSLKLVAWRPVDGDVSTQETTVSVVITGYHLANTNFVEIGLSSSGPLSVSSSFSHVNTSWTLKLTGYPRVANIVVV